MPVDGLAGSHDEDHGFTLVELLVVMIIIGLLASIAIPVFLNQRAKAHQTAAVQDARSIAEGVAGANVAGKNIAGFSSGPRNTYIVTYTDGSQDSFDIQPLSAGSVVIHSWIAPSGTPYCVEVANDNRYVQARDTGMSTSATPQCATKPAGALGS